MSWILITCGSCGHQDDIDRFCSTPVFGKLPNGVYQCPKCHRAIEKRHGEPIIYSTGQVIPGNVSIVKVDSRL
jgi:hypothetical protein